MKKLKILTMDLETRTLKGVMEVISASIFNGKKYTTFYLGDYYQPSLSINGEDAANTKLYNVNQMLKDSIFIPLR